MEWKYDTLPIYTCLDKVPITIIVVDKENGEDEDSIDDYIDISPLNKDCSIRGSIYRISEDMLYIEDWNGDLQKTERIGDK